MWCEIGSWPSVVADAVQQKLRDALPSRKPHVSRTALVVGLALTVAACSSIDSMFGDEPPPTARTSGAASTSKDSPKLSTVPARPERPTPPPQQGLAADRSGARYADSEVRPVNEAADAVVGQRLGASTPAPRPAGQGAAVQPAAAPVTPVQSAPTTPVQQQPTSAPPQASVQQAPVAPVAPVAQAPMQAPMPAPMASTLPPPPAPSQQALILPPTTRPSVSSVAGRAPSARPTPVYYGNNIQVAIVQFGRASSGLSSDDLSVLRDVAEIQKKQGGTVRIVGHASQDSTGSDAQRLQEGNYTVSLARANAIAGQLVRFGVPRGSVVVEAAGDQQPEYDPVTAVAVASNRRAEIYLAF
jgi:outer membrane protein OmpA-like peptidoglycan-associated protein